MGQLEKIYSRIEPSRILHIVHRVEDFGPRQELIDATEVLQVASFASTSGQKFRAHRHLTKRVEIEELSAQESWVVISGVVRVYFFDLDDSLIASKELRAGDTSITVAGGHGYEIVNDARVIEFKTGPYLGQAADKTFIE